MELNNELADLGAQLAAAASIRQKRYELTERINMRNTQIKTKHEKLLQLQETVSSLGDEILDLREANVADILQLEHLPEPDTKDIEERFDAALEKANLNKGAAA